MKHSLLALAASLLLPPLALAADSPAPKADSAAPAPKDQKDKDSGPLKDQKDKVSYSIGLDIGTTLKRQLIDVNETLLSQGVHDGVTGGKPLLTDEQVKEVMGNFQKDMLAKQAAARKVTGEKNAEEGKKFLEQNKSKPGIKTTASGLQYKIEKEGSGASPKESDTVKVNYRGTLINGTEFDSSYKRGAPATFPVNRVIKGWTEALQLMKPGAKYQLFVPADLAYGERGAGSDIGPNAMLTFDVELVEVVAPTPTPKPATYDSSRPAGSPGAAIPPKAAKPSPSPSPAKQ
jgi:FKBP-type peptidyl-prolyl cis-trans isomerase FklB